MKPLKIADVTRYIEKNISAFHKRRVAKLQILDVTRILRGKNPYLFRAKAAANIGELLDSVLSAYLSSSEEGMLGDFLEGLAIFINRRTFGGHKSAAPGIDIEFDRDGVHWLVSVKSGPNWGNSSQIRKMVSDFDAARRTFRTSGNKGQIECVNGCCYGRNDSYREVGNYYKYSGQRFWEFISGSDTLYRDLLTALGHRATEANQSFQIGYVEARARLLAALEASGIANEDGTINWEQFADITSKRQPTRKRQMRKPGIM